MSEELQLFPTRKRGLQRAMDRVMLRVLAQSLKSDSPLPIGAYPLYRAAIERYLAEDYPAPSRGRRSEYDRNYWIAVDYWLRLTLLGDKFAASTIRQRVKKLLHIELTAAAIERIGMLHKKATKQQVAYSALLLRQYAGGEVAESHYNHMAVAESMWHVEHNNVLEEYRNRPKRSSAKKK